MSSISNPPITEFKNSTYFHSQFFTKNQSNVNLKRENAIFELIK